MKRERESKTESEQRLRERVIEGDMRGVAAVGIAYLSWDSNDKSMYCLKVVSPTSFRERENKTESEQGIRERERRRVIEGDTATMCE